MSTPKLAPQVVQAGAFVREPFDTPQLTRFDMKKAAELLQEELGPDYRFEDCLRTVQARARRIESNAPKAQGYRDWFKSVGIELKG